MSDNTMHLQKPNGSQALWWMGREVAAEQGNGEVVKSHERGRYSLDESWPFSHINCF